MRARAGRRETAMANVRLYELLDGLPAFAGRHAMELHRPEAHR